MKEEWNTKCSGCGKTQDERPLYYGDEESVVPKKAGWYHLGCSKPLTDKWTEYTPTRQGLPGGKEDIICRREPATISWEYEKPKTPWIQGLQLVFKRSMISIDFGGKDESVVTVFKRLGNKIHIVKQESWEAHRRNHLNRMKIIFISASVLFILLLILIVTQ